MLSRVFLLRHFVYYYVTSCAGTLRGNRGEGKTPQTYGGENFQGQIHAASRGKIWRVEMTVNRGSNTTDVNKVYKHGI